MKQSFSKTFISALAGSILLVVALFVMNNMQPQNQVVQAATAVQAPALAADVVPTVTLSHQPEAPIYTEGFTFTLVRTGGETHIPMTATLNITGTAYGDEWVLATDKDGKDVTSTMKIDAKLYPGTYDVVATLVQSGTIPAGEFTDEVKVMPIFKFDSAVPSEIMLGDCLTTTVKVQPAIDYMTDTGKNEKVAYDFGGGSKVKEVVVDASSSFIKEGKLDSTYIYADEYCDFLMAKEYPVKATYNSGLYGATAGEITKTVMVNNPVITVSVKSEVAGTDIITTAKSGDMVRVWVETSKAISPTVMAIATGPKLVHQEAMTATQTMIYMDYVVPNVTAVTPLTISGVLASDKYGSADTYGAITGLGAKNIVTEGYTTVMVEPSGLKVDEVNLTAEPASPIAAGKTYTLTATLTDKAGEVVTDTEVMFKVTNTDTGDMVSEESKNSDDAGEAVHTITSDEPVTYTVVAVSEGVTSTQELTLKFESGEITKRYNPEEETTLDSEDGKVTITIPAGAYTETLDILFEESEGEPTEAGKLKAGAKKYGFFYVRFYRIVDGVRGAEIVPPPIPLKPISIKYARLTVGNTTLQQSQQVPLSDTQLLKVSTYNDPSWNNMPSTVETTGSDLAVTGTTMAPGNPYGVITANNEVYLPKVNKPEETTPTTTTLSLR